VRQPTSKPPSGSMMCKKSLALYEKLYICSERKHDTGTHWNHATYVTVIKHFKLEAHMFIVDFNPPL